jgi:hypothetical protein
MYQIGYNSVNLDGVTKGKQEWTRKSNFLARTEITLPAFNSVM